jgi:hypothetical protein
MILLCRQSYLLYHNMLCNRVPEIKTTFNEYASALHKIKFHENSSCRLRFGTYWRKEISKLLGVFLEFFYSDAPSSCLVFNSRLGNGAAHISNSLSVSVSKCNPCYRPCTLAASQKNQFEWRHCLCERHLLFSVLSGRLMWRRNGLLAGRVQLPSFWNLSLEHTVVQSQAKLPDVTLRSVPEDKVQSGTIS